MVIWLLQQVRENFPLYKTSIPAPQTTKKIRVLFEPNSSLGTSLVVQWLRLHTSTANSTGSIPGQGTKIPHAVLCNQKENKDSDLFFWLYVNFVNI